MDDNMRCLVRYLFTVLVFILGTINTNAQTLYKVISSSRLNVRELPNSNSKVLGTLSPNTQIGVTKFIDEWAEFNYNGQFAYVSSKYIAKIDTEKVRLFKVVSASHLNVRHQPSTNAQVLGTLREGEEIEVLSNTGTWAKIRYKNNIGYVSIRYISEVVKETTPVIQPEDNNVIEIKNNNIDNVPKVDIDTSNENKNNLLDNIGIEFVPNVYCGYANFASSGVSPKGTVGCGVDFAFQFIAKDGIAFIPKDYFMEASLGYSLRGSAAFPMHYINLKLQPFGYRHNLSEFTLFGKLGIYTGYTFSTIETNRNSFDSNVDVGLTISIGAEYKNIGIGISYERGFTNVCNSNLPLKNQGVFINLSYRLFSFR